MDSMTSKNQSGKKAPKKPKPTTYVPMSKTAPYSPLTGGKKPRVSGGKAKPSLSPGTRKPAPRPLAKPLNGVGGGDFGRVVKKSPPRRLYRNS